MVLERSGAEVVSGVSLDDRLFRQIDEKNVDAVLVDLDDNATRSPEYLERMVDRIHRQCRIPVLFNDSSSASDGTGRDDLGRKLSLKLTALTGRA